MDRTEKKKVKIGEIRKMPPCCPETSQSAKTQCCPEKRALALNIPEISTDWSWEDHIGQIRCRISSFRDSYRVNPGLYAIGAPDGDSDIFVSANYKLSFDILRRALKDMNTWVLVLDTKGINVWCAAGKGAFGTEEIVKKIFEANLAGIVNHRRIIVPQLGAPGISAHLVKERTGFRVFYGPVRASDIPQYIKAGYKSTKEMRTVSFSWLERLILTPTELKPAFKYFPLYALITLLIFGLKPSGIIFGDAILEGWPFLFLGVVSGLSGGFITPLFLPVIPFHSFAVKGWLTGIIFTGLSMKLAGLYGDINGFLLSFTYIFFPMISSFIAMQFTGATTFTSMSGVKRELTYALPAYKASAAVSTLLLLVFKLEQWGVI
jgi:hypothetical protein